MSQNNTKRYKLVLVRDGKDIIDSFPIETEAGKVSMIAMLPGMNRLVESILNSGEDVHFAVAVEETIMTLLTSSSSASIDGTKIKV